jgi:hypothetical protein
MLNAEVRVQGQGVHEGPVETNFTGPSCLAHAATPRLDAFSDRAGDVSLGHLFDELNARHFSGRLRIPG